MATSLGKPEGMDMTPYNKHSSATGIWKRLAVGWFAAAILAGCATAPQPAPVKSGYQLDPLVEYRYLGVVERSPTGETARSQQVIAAFKKHWACPANGAHSGPCQGWAIDHVIPLACGGADAVWNLQWLPDQIKLQKGEFSKDHFERRIYGGHAMSEGCP